MMSKGHQETFSVTFLQSSDYREVQDAAEQKMRKITLKDIIERYYEKAETAEQEFADLTAVMTNQTAWK